MFKKARLLRKIRKNMNDFNRDEAFEAIKDLHAHTGKSIYDICIGVGFCDKKEALLLSLEHKLKNDEVGIDHTVENKINDLRLELQKIDRKQYDLDKAFINYKYDLDNEYELEIKKNQILLDHIDNEPYNNEKKEELKLEYQRNIAESRHKNGDLNEKELEKELSTIEGEKWFDFSIELVNPNDPSELEVSVDYNEYFIDWLIQNGYDINPSDFENVKQYSEEHYELVVEKWVKQTIVKLSAGLLVDQEDDSGETFRSVVASEPEGTIVEKLQIDKDNVDVEPDSEEFRKMQKIIKNRKSYR